MPRQRSKPFEIVGNLKRDESTGKWGIRLVVGNVPEWFSAGGQTFQQTQLTEPQEFHKSAFWSLWAFRNKVVKYTPDGSTITASADDVAVLVKHSVLQSDAALARIRREVQAFENLDHVPSAQRERIPEKVRLFVWQRDEGKCVRCGTRERLEFDHIIPVIEGGSNTERNIQLLCETCNRQKGRAV